MNETKTPKEWLADVFASTPEGDFEWRQTVAEDWQPWNCDDDECPVKWHKVSYAMSIGCKEGKHWIEIESIDEDGNWDLEAYWDETQGFEDVKDIMSYQDLDAYTQAWKDYYKYVAETGDDPLYEVLVSRIRVRKTLWTVTLLPTILMNKYGVRIMWVRKSHGKKITDLTTVPQEVRDYLWAVEYAGSWYSDAIHKMDVLKDVTDKKSGDVGYWRKSFDLEIKSPRSPKKVRDEIIQIAKDHLDHFPYADAEKE